MKHCYFYLYFIPLPSFYLHIPFSKRLCALYSEGSIIGQQPALPLLRRFPQREDADEVGHDRAEIEGERHVIPEKKVVDRPAEDREDNDELELSLILEIEKPRINARGGGRQQPEPAVGVEREQKRELRGDERQLPRHGKLPLHAEEIPRYADDICRDARKRAENGV